MEEIKLKWKKKEGIFLSDKEDSRFADSIWCFSLCIDSCWTNAKIETALGRASSYVNFHETGQNLLALHLCQNGDTP